MKTLKQFLFIYLFLLSTFVSFAEEPGQTANYRTTRFDLERYKSIRSDSGTPDLRHVEFGVRYMPTFSSLDFNSSDGNVIEGSFVMSHGYGIMLGINLTKNIGIQGEVNYYQTNQKYADNGFNHDLTINYLNVPVLLSINTNKSAAVNLNLVAGPQFGFNVGSKFETTGNGNGSSTTTAAVALKKADVGVAYGAGLEFALNPSHTFRLDLGFRGFYGLVDMDASTTEQGTYNVIVHASRKTYGGYAGLAWMF